MARVKLYEVDAKHLLFPNQLVFSATTKTSSGELTKFFGKQPLVVKVDQGIKKRGKQGLVGVNLQPVEVIARIREWSDRGFSHFIVEPMLAHNPSDEHYLSLERVRGGWKILFSEKGGIDVESNWDQVTDHLPPIIHNSLPIIQQALDKYHISFLELNPVLIDKKGFLTPLDAAALIDDAALGLAELAAVSLTPVADRVMTQAEQEIVKLDDSTPASLKFRLINPAGKIWMFLSGGGASLVLADEVADLGLGSELANYGEYSGAPTDDDVYSYSKIILKEVLKSQTDKKALVIAGGVANFTDVGKTFKGLIRAMDEVKEKLAKSGVKVFVRRGGPNEKRGLAMMEHFLQESHLYGSVHGHETPLTNVVKEVKEYLT